MRDWRAVKYRTSLKILRTLITLTRRTILPAFPMISMSFDIFKKVGFVKVEIKSPAFQQWPGQGKMAQWHKSRQDSVAALKMIICWEDYEQKWQKSALATTCLKKRNFRGEKMKRIQYSKMKNSTTIFSGKKNMIESVCWQQSHQLFQWQEGPLGMVKVFQSQTLFGILRKACWLVRFVVTYRVSQKKVLIEQNHNQNWLLWCKILP